MALAIWTVSNLMVFIVCSIILFILLRYGSKKIHYVWAFLNLVAGIWGLGGFLIGLARNSTEAMLFWKIGLAGATLTPIGFYHLVVTLGDFKRKILTFLVDVFGMLFLFVSLFDLCGIKIVYIYNSLYYIRATDYRLVSLLAIWAVIIIYSIFEMYKLYLQASGTKRMQFLYLLIGLSTGFVGAILNAMPMVGINIFPAANNVLICFYCVLVTYAILRHQLLDIEVIIKKTLVFAGLLASVFAILILPTLLIQEYIFRDASMGGRLIGLTISGIIIILTMRRLENFLINVTDKYLFQKKYDYKELLKTFTSEVLTVLSLGKLVNLTVDKLDDIMKLKSSAVLLFDEFEGKFNVVASRNLKDPTLKLSKSDNLVAFLEHVHGYFSRKEMAEKKIFIPANVQDVIDKLNAELMIPMVLQEKMIGILSLGKKKSDEDYSQDDLDILLPLARTLAIAISNAQLFEQLGKAQAEAAQKEKMAVIGTLSAGINHEICNPLGIARGQCEAFLLNVQDGLYDHKSSEELLDKAKYIMELVMKEVDRATVITKKLSSFAKPSKGVAETVNINTEVDYVLSLVGHELRLEKIEVEKNIPPDALYIYVDRKQFQEVLFNLIRNAGQAIGEKGKIAVLVRQLRDKVIIDISDTGSGIPDDKLRELFNPFFTTKGPDKGTGLGLFIVRQVVEKNHGRIYLKETKVGHGTTFTIEFPAATPEMVAETQVVNQR